MSKIFDFTRGSYIRFDVKPSVVSIDALKGVANESGILVTNFQFTDQEKNSIIQCFNNTNHIYAFGHDPESSGFAVTFSVFMGAKCSKEFKDSGNLGKIIRQYKGARVSERGGTVTVSFGKSGPTLVGIVLAAQSQLVDPGINMASVTVSGKSLYLK